MPLKFLRPHEMRTSLPAYRVMADGREICSKTVAGRKEMKRRLRMAWERDRGICGICNTFVPLDQATPDHKKLRKMGGGERDDRVENLAPTHSICNAQRGSKRAGFYGF